MRYSVPHSASGLDISGVDFEQLSVCSLVSDSKLLIYVSHVPGGVHDSVGNRGIECQSKGLILSYLWCQSELPTANYSSYLWAE